ncbi:hypothetical protein IGI37_001608 [Enterococcus sp. AZ194]|uniref:DUF7278 family profilin-like fold-containing protein n=1 Tax=Enterococcus sp. AZ194 TaxID=2774629 RepID=UPI003F233B87
MNFFEQLQWHQWGKLTQEDKQLLFRQILMYYVSPLVKVSDVQLVTYEFEGITCTSFECKLDEEAFVFIPGNKKAVLGWELGIQELSEQDVLYRHRSAEHSAVYFQFKQIYGFETLEDFNDYVNDFTTPVRTVAVAPMLVQKQPCPIGTHFLGNYQTMTGQFVGDEQAVAPFLSEIKQQLSPQLSFTESLTWEFPRSFGKEDAYYLEQSTQEDTYSIYQHTGQTHRQLLKEVHSKGFDLLTEDQWEYVVGVGSRQLFRWGNELDTETTPQERSIRAQHEGQNMFGLFLDTSKTRFEMTQNPTVLKFDIIENSGSPIIDSLPLSTYYQSGVMIQGDYKLAPEEFLYRKVIPIEMVQ